MRKNLVYGNKFFLMDNINNQYQKIIETLINEGHVILQVFNQDGSCYYFSVMNFQESFMSSTNSVDFNSVQGINITDFMRTQGGNPNSAAVVAKFNEYITNAPVVRCEFSKNYNWMKWGSASR